MNRFVLPYEPYGINESERCIEVPWAISQYNGEAIILDIGYANAEMSLLTQFTSLNSEAQYHGIDLSYKNVPGVISAIGDIRNSAYKDGVFDLIYCISTLEHIGRDNTAYGSKDAICNTGDVDALREMHRILNLGGKIIITVPYGRYNDYGWFIQYDNRLLDMIRSVNFTILQEDYFIYVDGWRSCNKYDLENTMYRTSNYSAGGIVCLLLTKDV